MKLIIKSKLLGNTLSDGSFIFLPVPSYYSSCDLNPKKLDAINHPVWTGKRPKEQTEIAAFVDRFKKSI
uniref:Ribosomal protein L31 n=1 Tax=Desmarestia viridis TaxID=62313 RepID=Q2TUD6_9PHAE|nr:ribosomal protein L31 [Desmarestia viridis]AAS79060.1 ribosomal protein L31 [Desmarestia viridis]